tara:strand:- start:70 stop:2184 length:2115 start_codon:yes stop_codon:yes gene_type:complete
MSPIQQMLLGVGAVASGVSYETFAIDFDPSPKGASNEIKCASTSDFAFGTGAFTIEFYINIPRLMPTNHVVIFEGRPDGTNGAYVTLYFNGNTQLVHYGGSANSVGEVIGPSSDTEVPYEKWVHVALVRSGTGSNQTKLYINGVSGSNAQGTDTQDYGNQECKFGGAHAFNTPIFKSLVSNYRVTKGQAIYSANFTPSFAPLTTTSQSATASNVKLLCAQASNPLAATVTPSTLTQESETASRPLNRTIGVNLIGPAHSVDFDGTGDKLSIANHSDLQIGSSTYTMEFWVYKNADTPNDYDCWAAKGSNNNSTREFAIESMSDQTIDWYYATAGNSWSTVEDVSDGAISNNQWVHICAQKDSNGYFSFFVNGTRTYNSTTGGATLNTGADPFCIAGFADANTNFESNVKISNFRFIKGTALYSSSFTPSTEPLTNVTNTKLLCCNDSSSTTTATVTPGTITANGNPLVSGSNPFHKYSVFFDGSDDYLEMGSHSDIQFGTGDFTIELWWNGMSHGSYTQIIGTQSVFDANTGTWRIGTMFGDANRVYFARGNGSGFDEFYYNVDVNDGSWHHIACVRASNIVTFYIDGVAQGTPDWRSASVPENRTISGTCSSNEDLWIGKQGRPSGVWAKGKMSNIRLVKGTAVYTSNFTPSTTPLTAITNTVLLCCNDGASDEAATVSPASLSRGGAPQLSEDNPFDDLYGR